MIEIKNICKSYGDVEVLKNVSLSIKNGEVISIIGHSGSGKSTLINCIAGLTPFDSGSITFNGKTLKEISSHGYNHIGMVFQENTLFPHLTVLQNLTLAPVTVLA